MSRDPLSASRHRARSSWCDSPCSATRSAERRARSAARCLALLALLGASTALSAASGPEDPYLAWRQGRMADAEHGLLAQVRADQAASWASWYDCARAASACGDRGVAMACLWEAHCRAPRARAPLAALRARGAAIAPTWCERLAGPAWCAGSWRGPAASALGASVLALAVLGRIRRRWALLGALALAVVALGAAAARADARAPYAVVRVPSALVGGDGASAMLGAGTLVRLREGGPWPGMVGATAPDGASGWIARDDLGPPRGR